MREELRGCTKAREPSQSMDAFVNGILVKLDKAEELLKNDTSFNQGSSPTSTGLFADIEGLKTGFGTYAGERRDIGEAQDPAKLLFEAILTESGCELDETLKLDKEGNYDGALVTSRSAYLESYESIDIPLRPIDPDFTLEMEIKFAD